MDREHRKSAASATPLPEPPGVEQAPLWLAQAIDWAHRRGATDLHLFPSEGRAMLWVRIDGDLSEAAAYSLEFHARMIARLKVLGRCTDYAGELLQEGRFTLNGRAAAGEARLSIVPTLHGEKAVIRLVAGGEGLRPLDGLGLGAETIEALRDVMDRPQGLLLAVGPSGCGKSTALYALLEDLNRRAARPVSIVTIEDPVEQTLPFAAQIGADPARGIGFADGLRAVLRQDPEVVMIGEIRDAETARAALQAAMTGHRLLSSMHTQSAAEALVRLRQMGAAPFEIASALAGVLNIRLVGLLCAECRRARAMSDEELRRFPEMREWGAREAAEAPGCETCLGTGRRGRTAVGEWIALTPETADALESHRPAGVIEETLRVKASARPGALAHAREGKLALRELMRPLGLRSFGDNAAAQGKRRA